MLGHECAQESKELQPLVSEWIDHQIPVRCLAEVTDLQAAIVFMASPASDYMVIIISQPLLHWRLRHAALASLTSHNHFALLRP